MQFGSALLSLKCGRALSYHPTHWAQLLCGGKRTARSECARPVSRLRTIFIADFITIAVLITAPSIVLWLPSLFLNL